MKQQHAQHRSIAIVDATTVSLWHVSPSLPLLLRRVLRRRNVGLLSEVAFYCLDAIHPVTHAVANTVKRVFLIGVSILVFGHKLTPLGSIGSAVAIAGVLLYSLAKQKFPNKK